MTAISDPLQITEDLALPMSELRFATARSSGPGGQNVNKVETKVTVYLDLPASESFSEEQKARIGEQLSTRITKAGVLRVMSQKHRTQVANRKAAVERLADLLRDALTERAERKPTRKPRAAKQRRLTSKRERGELKKLRRRPRNWEDG